MTEKLFKIGCNVIVEKEGKVLLGQRKNCYGEGTWGFPGGHLEIGENLEDAARRELKEEVGIEEGNLQFLSVVEGSRDIAHYIQMNFLLKDFKGTIEHREPDQCHEWRFFDPEKIEVEIFWPHKKILNAYLQNTTYLI